MNIIQNRFFRFCTLVFFVFQFIGYPQDDVDELISFLKSTDGIEIVSKIEDDNFKVVLELQVDQPLDHKNLGSEKFKQQIFLSHLDKTKPVVFDLDGYAVKNRTTELTKLLNCNQIIIEHRYFGQSVPSPFDWKYLTIEQAANDHHKIIELFKQFYTGKFISTGISKGGSCVVFHKYFYPTDIDASVAYVGPLNYSIDDNRVYEWIKSVSTPECREKVHDFQRLCLEKRDEIYPVFLEHAENKKLTYNIVGYEKAYEYFVLEYSFAYWQWSNGDCSKIPNEFSSTKEIWDHLLEYGGVKYFDDSDITVNYPFFYQCYTDYGYYAYAVDEFKDLLEYADGQTQFFIPKDSNPVYNSQLLCSIGNWASNDAENIIYIYGGNDPWTSTGVCLTGRTNSLKMILANGSHKTRIKDFPEKDKKIIYSRLENWLGIKIDPK